jgi:glycosyltransferase involved in cell wall biosynthesis
MFREEQTLLHQRALWRRLVKQFALPLLLRGAAGLYIGTENKRWFEHFGVPKERLFFTPYSVDASRLVSQALKSRDELRVSFGLRTDVPVILTVTRLIPRKQPLALLEAFARLRAERPCGLLVVGSGVLEDEMRVRARDIPDVAFAGFLNQSEISRAYACADIFALFSRENETWGLAVNEAMHFGLPVVVSDKVGCSTDLVRDGENGFRVGVDDVAGLTRRLRLLVDDENLRRSFGATSRARVSSWTYDRAVEGVIAAAEAIARKGSNE